MLHPALPDLVRCALGAGMQAGVFSSLVHVPPPLWEVLTLPRVSLATSWYSADRAQHAAITGRDTWRQVKANIAQAVRADVSLRAGIIEAVVPGQDTREAAAVLESLGVPADITVAVSRSVSALQPSVARGSVVAVTRCHLLPAGARHAARTRGPAARTALARRVL
jgi:hypothetical protein